jgi:hypothetical protein
VACCFSKFTVCIYSGSGPSGKGDEIKPKMTPKVTKLHFFKTPRTPTWGKIAKFENMQICLASGPSDERFEKSIF